MKLINGVFNKSVNNIQIKEQISNKNLSVILLGEIYGEDNFSFIRNILNNYDITLKKITEVLLNTEGLFILIIEDYNNHSTHIINDKMGLFPFYYYKAKNSFIFGSDISDITNDIEKLYLNFKSIIEIVQLGYITSNTTIIKGIHKISPGHIFSFTRNKILKTKYYSFSKDNNNSSKEIYEVFAKGVNKRLIGDHIYSDLSGGFDTRLIMLTLVKKLNQKNIIFKTDEDYNKDDLSISKMISKKLSLNHIFFDKKSRLQYSHSFTGLCGGEILGNSLMKEWFMYDNIEEFVTNKRIKLKTRNSKYGIANFIKNILRSEISTVQGISWLNPTNYFKSNLLLPFLDTNFLEKVSGKKIFELKKYKLYKEIYLLYFCRKNS